MRRVWRVRSASAVALALLAAALLLLARGANEAEAAPFAPSLGVALASNAAGVTSNISSTSDWGNFLPFSTPARAASRNFPSAFAGFTPAAWGMPAAGTPAIAEGVRTGTASTVTTLGILNSACALALPIAFAGGSQPPAPGFGGTTALLDATNDGTGADTIASGAGFAALIADVDDGSGVGTYPNGNADGIMDGAQYWNNLLTALLGPLPPGQPIERQVATTNLFGTTIWVDIPTFSPGVVAPASLGFATLTIVENFSPALPATPGLITDSCGLRTTTTQEGVDFTGGTPHRTNPGPSQQIFLQSSSSERDADLDPTVPPVPLGPILPITGIVNSDDTCPFTPNVGNPLIPIAAFGGDAGESPPDGIDAACDPTPLAFSGSDTDGDAFLNRGDNCVFVSNPTQADVGEILAGPPADGGPSGGDGIGDACELIPHGGGRLPAVIDHSGVRDGHFHAALNLGPVCIGLADSDADGYCDLTEGGLGSNPASGASTPEALAIPTSCSDGADNDGDLATDLADSGCQLPLHDLAIRKTNGETVAGGASECQPAAPTGCGYNTILRNNSSVAESGQVGVLVDPIFGAGCSGPSAVLHGGSANPTLVASGPINIDGDTDVEWLLRVNVTIPAGCQSTVNFGVIYPTCGPNVGTPADYALVVDLCHDSDPAPLGLFGAAGCGDGASDGGMDTATANDAPVTRLINDVNR